MQFQIMWKDEVLADIVLPESGETAEVQIHSPNKFPELFREGTVDRKRIYQFVKSRCIEQGREDLPQYLELLGLSEYDPWQIIRHTHGVDWDDFYWLRFPGERLDWKDVRVRK